MGLNDKVNVLLVDDQPARLLTYESILGDLGQNLVRAGSGLEALEKLMKDEFAVVLLDVSMPDMDGFEAATLIHQHPRFEKTPIIFVTGVHISELDRLKGYKVGAVDYVSIPVVPEILRSKVAVLIELYTKRRELQELNRNLAQANERLAQANTTLQAEKTRELETLNRILQRANQELEGANRSLNNVVTERARVELALKEADRHKDEFLAMLAHELRNPLAPIHNAVQLMHRQTVTDPQLVWSRDVIRQPARAFDTPGGRSAGRVAHYPRQDQPQQRDARIGRSGGTYGGNRATPDRRAWSQTDRSNSSRAVGHVG